MVVTELERARLPFRILHLYRGEAFEGLDSFSHLIVMGGHMGVNDHPEYPWIQEEIALIRATIKAGKPVLGICLGAQMIAAAMGKRVFKNAQPELGWLPLRLTNEGRVDPIFRLIEKQPLKFQWHYDTFDLPEGAVLLASSAACANQAFRVGDHVLGLQFHPEVDAMLLNLWSHDPEAVQEAHKHTPFEVLLETALDIQEDNRVFMNQLLMGFLGSSRR